MRPVYSIVDEAHEYFDRSISDMLEQARKANIGLLVAHQSISQARGAKGGSNITDPLMVNTATKLIWTSFREDATKFAGSMQIKAEDILSLPQFTFGMHSRKQGFLPVRGVPDALERFEQRKDLRELKRAMEARYGVTRGADNTSEEEDGCEDGTMSAKNFKYRDTSDHRDSSKQTAYAGKGPKSDDLVAPPEVEVI